MLGQIRSWYKEQESWEGKVQYNLKGIPPVYLNLVFEGVFPPI